MTNKMQLFGLFIYLYSISATCFGRRK